jgi:osmoprotectant transport system ATP-binding protein
MAPPVFDVRGLTHNYDGVAALDGVTFAIESGECVAVLGESGSGKTTLLRSLNRMVEPGAGCIRFEGRDVLDIDPIGLRRRIGYVPQEGGLLPHWRVVRNVALVPRLLRHPAPEEAAYAALELVELEPSTFARRWPNQLSGGQRQRVALARALAARPDVVLLDEAFGALDPITRRQLHCVFRQLTDDLGLTSVLVTHDVNEAFRLADRVAVMRAGRVLQLAPAGDILERPADDWVRRFVASAPEAR